MVDGCNFCKGESFSFFHLIKRLGHSNVYIWPYQKHFPCRLIVAYHKHREELFELNDDELLGFMKDCAHVAEAINRAYPCDKINYGLCGDGQRHLHMHIVGKRREGYMWRNMFDTRTEDGDEQITQAELDEMTARVLEYL